MNRLNFVSCVSWVRCGAAKEIPNKLQLTKEEIQMKIEQDKQKLENLVRTMDIDAVRNDDDDNEREIVDRYNLDEYDNEEVNDLALNHGNLVVFDDNQMDPYLDAEQQYSDEEDEKDDFVVKQTDNLLLVGHVEEDQVSLEVKIYNEDEMYVHHELYLSAFPVCFEWLDFSATTDKGNFVAVGDMNKDVNIWDLDTVDVLSPSIILAGHNDAVLDLSWCDKTRHLLASGSADHTCRIWDLSTGQTVRKFDSFKSHIQSVNFHPLEANILLTGDCEGNACILNCQNGSIKKWKVCQEEIEKVVWNPFVPYTFLCATASGFVYGLDCRNENSHLMAIKAHNDTISGVEFSSSQKGCLVTSSSDKVLKVWNIMLNEAKFVKEIEPRVGTILSLSANPDLPFVFAVSGDNASENLKVIDISTFKAVRDHFEV